MKAVMVWAAGAALWIATALGTGGAWAADPPAAGKTLKPFADEAEFVRYMARLRALQERHLREVPPPPPAPMAAPASDAAAPGADMSAESITNVQTQGVDEGGIVKTSGDYLVVLRRGRLFTLRVAGDALQAVDTIDAFAPGSNPNYTWYDEMLVSGRDVVVIGYSYERGGTELGMFRLDADGKLSHRDTYHLRSSDYYSADNYASRLIGRKLIFYTPMPVRMREPAQFLPVLRRWHVGATPEQFKRLLPAQRIYRPMVELQGDDEVVLHTVSQCDLDAPELACESIGVLGPAGRVFYVSQSAVYVWATPWDADERARANASQVVRIPLDGAAPQGLRTSGSPIDQMSFLERDGHLNVLVGSQADGEGMWASHSRAGELAMLRVPLDRFGDARSVTRSADYRPLPGLGDEGSSHYKLHNRFIGDWLVYGGSTWNSSLPTPRAHALRYAGADPAQQLRLTHPVERIDALGSHAILIGAKGLDLHFTSVRLQGSQAMPASVHIQPRSGQGDGRTHGFFYRPTDDARGIVGLPIVGHDPVRNASTASVLYLRSADLRLRDMGHLDARPDAQREDHCKASCVDWYGNARPIFLGNRVFALMGYEMVEGRVEGERIVERRRADFAPSAATIAEPSAAP